MILINHTFQTYLIVCGVVKGGSKPVTIKEGIKKNIKVRGKGG